MEGWKVGRLDGGYVGGLEVELSRPCVLPFVHWCIDVFAHLHCAGRLNINEGKLGRCR